MQIKHHHTSGLQFTEQLGITTIISVKSQVNSIKNMVADKDKHEAIVSQTPMTPRTPQSPVCYNEEGDAEEAEDRSESQQSEGQLGQGEQVTKRQKKALTLEQMTKLMERYKLKSEKTANLLTEANNKRKSCEQRLRARIKELKSKKHHRRSPGTHFHRPDSSWVQALRAVSKEMGLGYTIFPRGSEGYQKAWALRKNQTPNLVEVSN